MDQHAPGLVSTTFLFAIEYWQKILVPSSIFSEKINSIKVVYDNSVS